MVCPFVDFSWRREHPIIQLDSVQETKRYQVMAAFYSRIYRQDEMGVFRYDQYSGNWTETAFQDYLKQVQKAALYDTGITATYDDQLLTLSTCSYHVTEGRFVVVAKALPENQIDFAPD